MVRPAGDVMPQFRTEGYGKAPSLTAHTFPGIALRPNAQARVRRPPFCSALLTKSSACCAHSASATSFSRTDCLKASRRASSSKIDSRWFLFCFFVPASIVRCQEPRGEAHRICGGCSTHQHRGSDFFWGQILPRRPRLLPGRCGLRLPDVDGLHADPTGRSAAI